MEVDAVETATQNVAQEVYSTGLPRKIPKHFNEDELRALCSDLNIRYDDLPGRGNASKARELVEYLHRRNRLPEFVEIVRNERPKVFWEDTSTATRQAHSTGRDHSDETTDNVLLAYLAYLAYLKALEESRRSRRTATIILFSASLVFVSAAGVLIMLLLTG